MSKAAALIVVALAAAPAHARPHGTYIKIDRPAMANPTPAGVTSSKIVYVKRCISGCDVHYDPVDDSRTGASSIATPLAPSGVTGEGCSSRSTSISGTSTDVGLR